MNNRYLTSRKGHGVARDETTFVIENSDAVAPRNRAHGNRQEDERG